MSLAPFCDAANEGRENRGEKERPYDHGRMTDEQKKKWTEEKKRSRRRQMRLSMKAMILFVSVCVAVFQTSCVEESGVEIIVLTPMQDQLFRQGLEFLETDSEKKFFMYVGTAFSQQDSIFYCVESKEMRVGGSSDFVSYVKREISTLDEARLNLIMRGFE